LLLLWLGIILRRNIRDRPSNKIDSWLHVLAVDRYKSKRPLVVNHFYPSFS
jgi:hypothetical protein